MKAEEFDAALERCIRAINDLPEGKRSQLMELVNETRDHQQTVDVSLREALDAIDDWRLYQKYMLFDMEARQRELADNIPEDAETDATDDVDWL